MARLVITARSESRVQLSKFYMLIREIVDYFGLEHDITCELED